MAEFENTDNSTQTDNVRENSEARGAENAMPNEVNESRQNASNVSDSRNNGSANQYLPNMEISGLDSENTNAPKDDTEKPQSEAGQKDHSSSDGTVPNNDQQTKEKPEELDDGKKDAPDYKADPGSKDMREQKNKPQDAVESKYNPHQRKR